MHIRLILAHYLPWFLSCCTVTSSWFAGDKKLMAIKISLFGQVFWSIWCVASATWGFIPLNLVLWVMYIRNYRKWKADDDRDQARRASRDAVGPRAWVLGVEAQLDEQQRVAGYAVSFALPDGSLHRIQGPREEATTLADLAARGVEGAWVPLCSVRQR